MPAAIDPAWEYWVPDDPDVAEILAESAATGGDPLDRLDAPHAGDFGSRREWAAAVGMRFGRRAADLNAGTFRMGRAVPTPADNAPTIGVCRGCGDGFRLRRQTQRFCSAACREARGESLTRSRRMARAEEIDRRLAANDRRRAKLAEFVTRFGAGERMADIAARLRVSRVALSLWRRQLGLRRARPVRRKRERPERSLKDLAAYYARIERFAELYAAGVRLLDIATALGVDHTTIGRWRRRLGLVKRRSIMRQERVRSCGRCGGEFVAARRDRRYCSPRCANATTAENRRVRPAVVVCECGAEFQPGRVGNRYCSKRCAARAGGGAVKPPTGLLARFAELYAAGGRMAEIAAAVGRSVGAIKKWRRQLGLPPRPNGNLTASRTGA